MEPTYVADQDPERDRLARSIAAELAKQMVVPKLMTAARAADYLGINVKAFQRIVSSGAVGGVQVPGLKHQRYSQRSLDGYIASLDSPPTPHADGLAS